MSLEANIKAREDAMQIVGLCGRQPPRFWEVLAHIAAEQSGLKIMAVPQAIGDGNALERMTDDEAAHFERTIVPFGKYAGEPVGDVPVGYWTYVTESDFNRKLIRYLRSDTFQRRQDDPE